MTEDLIYTIRGMMLALPGRLAVMLPERMSRQRPLISSRKKYLQSWKNCPNTSMDPMNMLSVSGAPNGKRDELF
jgi:hypothetical protein